MVGSLELPGVSFRAPRQTHVSALISSGLDVVTISTRIGHAKPTTTLCIYAHLLATDAAADAIEAVMLGPCQAAMIGPLSVRIHEMFPCTQREKPRETSAGDVAERLKAAVC